jgi:DeoR family transcriptional regulator of aga operon
MRKDKILAHLRDNSAATVSELSELCDVSEVTIRQDLNALAVEGMLVRTRGGAMLSGRAATDFSYATRMAINAEAKQRIGDAAAGLIQSGDSVLADASTTALYVMRSLALRHDLEDITVITNGVNVLSELASRLDINAFLTGGHFRSSSASLTGSFANDMLNKINATVGFFGARGITLTHGLMDVSVQDADVKQKMVERCQEVVIVADSSKFGQVSVATFAPIERVHRLITDEGIPADMLDSLRLRGLDVMVV